MGEGRRRLSVKVVCGVDAAGRAVDLSAPGRLNEFDRNLAARHCRLRSRSTSVKPCLRRPRSPHRGRKTRRPCPDAQPGRPSMAEGHDTLPIRPREALNRSAQNLRTRIGTPAAGRAPDRRYSCSAAAVPKFPGDFRGHVASEVLVVEQVEDLEHGVETRVADAQPSPPRKPHVHPMERILCEVVARARWSHPDAGDS